MTNHTDRVPLDAPDALLEHALIDEYLRLRGHSPERIRHRQDAEATALWADAVQYAALRLTEIESRAHYVQAVHGAGLEHRRT